MLAEICHILIRLGYRCKNTCGLVEDLLWVETIITGTRVISKYESTKYTCVKCYSVCGKVVSNKFTEINTKRY